MEELRRRYTPEELTGALAHLCGLIDRPEPVSPRELVPHFLGARGPGGRHSSSRLYGALSRGGRPVQRSYARLQFSCARRMTSAAPSGQKREHDEYHRPRQVQGRDREQLREAMTTQNPKRLR